MTMQVVASLSMCACYIVTGFSPDGLYLDCSKDMQAFAVQILTAKLKEDGMILDLQMGPHSRDRMRPNALLM